MHQPLACPLHVDRQQLNPNYLAGFARKPKEFNHDFKPGNTHQGGMCWTTAEAYGGSAESVPLVLRPCSTLGSIRAKPLFFPLNSEAGDQLILSVLCVVGAFARA